MIRRRITAGKMLSLPVIWRKCFSNEKESLDTVLHKSLPAIEDYFPSVVKQVADKLQRRDG